MREQYRSGGDEKASRLLRRGLPAQRLRAEVGMFIAWFRASYLQGWFASERRRETNPDCEPFFRGSHIYMQKLADKRADAGLDVPFGPAAVRLGIGPLLLKARAKKDGKTADPPKPPGVLKPPRKRAPHKPPK